MIKHRFFHLSWLSLILLSGVQLYLSQGSWQPSDTATRSRATNARFKGMTQSGETQIYPKNHGVPSQGRPVGRLRGGSSR